MELVTSLFTVVAGAAGAVETAGAGLLSSVGLGSAGTAAAATGASATGSLLGSVSTLSALSGTLTAGSMLMQAGQGVAAIQQGTVNANQAEIQAKEQALKISQDYVKSVGAARVAFAGSGVTIGNGSEAATESSLTDQATFETQLAKATGAANAAAATLQGDNAAAAAAGGILKTGANYLIDISKRGG